MKLRRTRIAIPLLAIAAAVGATGCGDDEEPDVTTPSISIPSVTAPTPPTTTAQEPTGGVAPQGTTTSKSGGVTPGKPDSAENDLPPAPGSPEEAFEKQCEQNPAACG